MAKSEFLANMSHEMRTPLAGTLGMIRLVLEMEIGDEERQLLEMADRSAESLVRIIGDVLDFSRLEAGMMSFEQELFRSRSDKVSRRGCVDSGRRGLIFRGKREARSRSRCRGTRGDCGRCW
jgi:signal transduction histidine kinase